MTLTFPTFNLSVLKVAITTTDATSTESKVPEHEAAYAERAFLREVIACNPEALQNDLGIMVMMSQYPRNF